MLDDLALSFMIGEGEKPDGVRALKQWSTCAYLDVNERHPELWGDCILLRDDDAMGFGFGPELKAFIGKHVRITIEEAPSHDHRLWRTDEEKRLQSANAGNSQPVSTPEESANA